MIFLDTNIICRWILKDTEHPRYAQCAALLRRGGLISSLVQSEVAYVFSGIYKQGLARDYACKNGKREDYIAEPKVYTLKLKDYPEGWKKAMYDALSAGWSQLLERFTLLELENASAFWGVLDVAKSTGLDWVDCYLLYLHRNQSVEVSTVDGKLLKELRHAAQRRE